MDIITILKRKAAATNKLADFSKASTGLYWDNFKRAVKVYFIQYDVKEISVNDFSKLIGLDKAYSKKMLAELNSDIFKKDVKKFEDRNYYKAMGLTLPEKAKVKIEKMPGMDYYILWVDCPTLENILYSHIKKSQTATEIVKCFAGWELLK
jgi:hypothetical protein